MKNVSSANTKSPWRKAGKLTYFPCLCVGLCDLRVGLRYVFANFAVHGAFFFFNPSATLSNARVS